MKSTIGQHTVLYTEWRQGKQNTFSCPPPRTERMAFLNTRTCPYLRPRELIIRHQQLPKSESNPQVRIWPSRDQSPGCRLDPPRSSHFTKSALEMTFADFSPHIAQNAFHRIAALTWEAPGCVHLHASRRSWSADSSCNTAVHCSPVCLNCSCSYARSVIRLFNTTIIIYSTFSHNLGDLTNWLYSSLFNQ